MANRRGYFGLLTAMVLAASVPMNALGAVVYSTGMENTPAADGWQLTVAAGDTLSGVTNTVAHSGQNSLLLANSGSSWSSSIHDPSFQGGYVNSYGMLSYYTKGSGATIVNEHYESSPSTDWQLNQSVSQIAWYGNSIRAKTDSPVYIDDIQEIPMTSAQVAAYSDSVYASMPAKIVPPPAVNQLGNIPNTIHALQTGKSLQVLMLGDSIVNDTWNSNWETLVQSHNPGTTISTFDSVRGGTGAGYYKDPTNFKNYVLNAFGHGQTTPYKPDVIMIGGISNDSAASVQTVVQMIRANNMNAEIILMDTAAGSPDLYPLDKDWNAPIDPNGTDYRSQLYKVALEEHTGFIDLSAVWGKYLQDLKAKGLSESMLKRDGIHTNYLGQAIIAQAIDSYFSAVAPEPASLSLLLFGGLVFLKRR